MPILTDDSLKLMGYGIMYLHGRSKDYAPILILDMKRLQDLLTAELITHVNFC